MNAVTLVNRVFRWRFGEGDAVLSLSLSLTTLDRLTSFSLSFCSLYFSFGCTPALLSFFLCCYYRKKKRVCCLFFVTLPSSTLLAVWYRDALFP